ncbi:MAG: enoyl-CoA hydratase/isomerase family protein [Alphaproteobacteria bacterium]|nr:enoyl-CoA hydratase/isomerase family protein [Alphaproteobacteria bacterium]
MSDTLLVSIQNGRADVTLNRPEIHNAFDEALIAELTELLTRLGRDDAVRAVVLSGSGKSFSAGGDLNWMKRFANYSFEQNVEDAKALALVMQTLDELPKPTIARVQGAAYGGGVGLVACCDIAVAVPSASFCLSEVKLGIIPAVISPYVIAAMGARAARRYFLTAERFDGVEAHRLGLVHELADNEEQLDKAVDRLVATLAANGPQAIASSKDLIRAVAQRPITQDVRLDTARRIAERRASAEGKEGVGAFLEKRKPTWQ